jgi:hypothetical protein
MTDIEGESHLLEVLLLYAALMLMGCAIIVWAGWIRPFVRSRGRNTCFALLNWAPIVDYRAARHIAKTETRMPWFIRLFEVFFGGALAGILLFFLRLLVSMG